jgi:protein SCO1
MRYQAYFLLSLAFGLPTISAAASAGGAAAGAATPVTIGGPFTLMAADGSTVTDQTYRGKWLIVYFGYTFCPDTCPTVLNKIANVLQGLGSDAARVQPLFITIDPRRDTPQVLADYVSLFDPRITGLTGSPGQIATVAQEYGVYYTPHPSGPKDENYPIDHSSYIYLMDPKGNFVRGFDVDTTPGQLTDAVRRLLIGAPGSSSG